MVTSGCCSPAIEHASPVHSTVELSPVADSSTIVYTSSPLVSGCTVVPVHNISAMSPSSFDMKMMDFVDFLPLPPSPHLLAGNDDVDSLPLPPPPMELCFGYLPPQTTADYTSQLSAPASITSSSHESRRDLMRNMAQDPSSVETCRQGNSSAMRRAVSARRASEVSHFGFTRTPVKATGGNNADCNMDEDIVETLKRGVKLKKTISRDRSAPRLPIQHM